MKSRICILIALGLIVCATGAQAGVGLSVKAGTLGFGAEATVAVAPRVNVRGGAQFLNFGLDHTESDIKYDIDLKLRSLSLLLDLYPFPTFGFRLTGGMVFNSNEAVMTGVAQGTYDIGGSTYTGAQIGQLVGKMTFGETAPYVGIGWGNAAVRKVGFALDLGVAFQGEPHVALSATGPIAADPNFRAELQREQDDIQEGADEFKYYPVVAIGLNFKIW